MKMFALLLLAVSLCFLSCKDQGEVPVEKFTLLRVTPESGAINIPKGAKLQLQFSSTVTCAEMEKITIKYVDDGVTFQGIGCCGECYPQGESLKYGPFIWKPGKQVEVSIPPTMYDMAGRVLGNPTTIRFTIAQDTVPLQLLSTSIGDGDTLALQGGSSVNLKLNFTDYIREFIPEPVTTQPPVYVHQLIRIDGPYPKRELLFMITNLQPNNSYLVTVPQSIKDYEGETLPQDYRIVFYTKP